MLKIFEISSQIRDVQTRIDAYSEDHDGLIPDDLDALYGALEWSSEKCKLDMARRYLELKYEADAMVESARRIQSRATSISKHADYIKSVLISHCQEGQKVADATNVISWRKSTALEITDESAIPEQWFKIERSPKKAEIKQAIMLGKPVAGAVIVDRQNIQLK